MQRERSNFTDRDTARERAEKETDTEKNVVELPADKPICC